MFSLCYRKMCKVESPFPLQFCNWNSLEASFTCITVYKRHVTVIIVSLKPVYSWESWFPTVERRLWRASCFSVINDNHFRQMSRKNTTFVETLLHFNQSMIIFTDGWAGTRFRLSSRQGLIRQHQQTADRLEESSQIDNATWITRLRMAACFNSLVIE